ncbi:MAG: twin-arginine translocase TatA/TatE family subunit [Kofleriaceae bacterium]
MFGMGGTEILVILVVALLFLGPDKLPEAAKKISQGIRDIKKQTRVLQRTIEDDEHIGGAIRDLKSALRGDDEPIRPAKARAIEAATAVISLPEPAAATPDLLPASVHEAVTAPHGVTAYDAAADDAVAAHAAANGAATTYAAVITPTEPAEVIASTVATPAAVAAPADVIATTSEPAKPGLTMPPTAGEADEDAPRSTAADHAALSALVRPAPNTIARTTRTIARVVPTTTKPALIPARPAPVAAAEPAASAAEPAASAAEPNDPSEPKHG